MIATAVEAELAGYLAQFTDLRTEAGHAAVVRNGHNPARPFQTSIGPVSVRIPKVWKPILDLFDVVKCLWNDVNIRVLHVPKINLEKGLAAVLARYYTHSV